MSDDDIDWPEHATLPPAPWEPGRFELMDHGVLNLGLEVDHEDRRDPDWMKGIADSLRFHHTERLYTMPSDEKLTPERAVRLLRAKNAELEAIVLHTATNPGLIDTVPHQWKLTADLALLFAIVADHIERTEDRLIDGVMAATAATQQRLAQDEQTCLATRWNGHPVYEGEQHDPHSFKYGPNDMYEGHCAGWMGQ